MLKLVFIKNNTYQGVFKRVVDEAAAPLKCLEN